MFTLEEEKTFKAEQLLDLLVVNAYNFYSNTLMKNYDYFKTLEVGNLVLEITSLSNKANNKNRIGYLKRIISESEYIIETLDGREVHWENADFIRVQTELFELKRY